MADVAIFFVAVVLCWIGFVLIGIGHQLRNIAWHLQDIKSRRP